MTNSVTQGLSKKTYEKTFAILMLAFAVLISAFLSPIINGFVKDGVSLCFEAIIGSLFPFMILSDAVAMARFESITFLRTFFEKIFKINGNAISAFIMGIICGFPIGVKVSVDLYKRGQITRDECERLISFSNNTGPAFVIAGIGCALRGSLSDGIILYVSMLISAIITGYISGIGKVASKWRPTDSERFFSFTESIKKATQNTLSVCGFVITFSVICGLISILVSNNLLHIILLPLIEVSNAAKQISASSFLPNSASLSLSSFAISFSGLSVHMQAKCFISECNLSMKRYWFYKLLQGIISATLTAITVVFI